MSITLVKVADMGRPLIRFPFKAVLKILASLL